MYRQFKYRNKILALLALTGIFPILILSVLTYNAAYHMNYNQILKQNEIVLKFKQSALDRLLNDLQSDGVTIASSDFINTFIDLESKNSASGDRFNNILTTYLETYATAHDFTDIFIKDINLTPIFALKDGRSHTDLQCQCRRALELGKPIWSQIHFSEKYDSVVLSLSIPIRSKNKGIPQGVITFVMPQATLLKIIHKDIKNIGETGDAYLIDNNQNLLTQTLLGDRQSENTLFQMVDTQGTRLLRSAMMVDDFTFTQSALYTDYRGIEVLGTIGIVMIGDNPAGLLIEIDYEEAFKRTHTLKATLFALSALTIIFSVFLSLKLSTSMTRPISQLENGIKKIVSGNLNHQIPIESYDEIGIISKAFNAMTSELSTTLISKEKMGLIFDAMSDGIIVTQADGTITYMNQIAKNTFCKKDVACTSARIQDIMQIIYKDENNQEIYRDFEPPSPQTSSEIVIELDKEKRRYHVEHSILNSAPHKSTETVSIFRDITALKQIEDSLTSAAQSAERASQAKGYFLANMSHEIRTPLNSIIGYSEYLRDNESNLIKIDSLDSIIHSGKLLQEIVDDILDYSKIESGIIKEFNGVFSPTNQLNKLVKMFELSANSKNIEIHTHLTGLVPKYAFGDAYKIQQILVNLVSNAIKFTTKGYIELQMAYIHGTLQISITDTGPGITAEEAEHIFAPFEQADITTSRTHGGTGLGLTISKTLISHLGGQLDLKSEIGVGSTFIVKIPVLALPDFQDFDDSGATLVNRWIGKNENLEDLTLEVIDRLPHYLENINNALQSRNKDQIYHTAHAMKGVTLNYSMHEFSEILNCILEETRHQAPNLKYIQGLYAMLDNLVERLPEKQSSHGSHRNSDTDTGSSRIKILIADDLEMNRRLIHRLLGDLPITMHFASNGMEALNMMYQEDYMVLLLDIQMPVLNGIDVLNHLKDPTNKLKGNLPYIIVMSAIATSDEVERIKDLDCDDYLTKPISGKDLRGKLKTFIKNQAFFS